MPHHQRHDAGRSGAGLLLQAVPKRCPTALRFRDLARKAAPELRSVGFWRETPDVPAREAFLAIAE